MLEIGSNSCFCLFYNCTLEQSGNFILSLSQPHQPTIPQKLFLLLFINSANQMYEGLTPSDPKNSKLFLVFEQANKVIASMLENLSYIYKANGISFEVKNHHAVIMRILSPIELFNAEKERSSWAIFPPTSQLPQSTINEYPKIKDGDKDWENNYDEEAMSTSQLRQGSQLKKRGSQLGEATEKYLCKWALQRAKRGLTVQRKDIIDQACKLAEKKNIDFQGSSGWYSRFKARNPNLKNMMQVCRQKFDQNELQRQNSDSQPWRFVINQASDSFIVKQT